LVHTEIEDQQLPIEISDPVNHPAVSLTRQTNRPDRVGILAHSFDKEKCDPKQMMMMVHKPWWE